MTCAQATLEHWLLNNVVIFAIIHQIADKLSTIKSHSFIYCTLYTGFRLSESAAQHSVLHKTKCYSNGYIGFCSHGLFVN